MITGGLRSHLGLTMDAALLSWGKQGESAFFLTHVYFFLYSLPTPTFKSANILVSVIVKSFLQDSG